MVCSMDKIMGRNLDAVKSKEYLERSGQTTRCNWAIVRKEYEGKK